MKKIVLSMALCVVLFGAVTTVTGCGKKPRNDALLQVKGTVWEETVVPPPPPPPHSTRSTYPTRSPLSTVLLLSFGWAFIYGLEQRWRFKKERGFRYIFR